MLEILLKTAELYAVNKPEGMPTIPGGGRADETALSEAQAIAGGKLYVVHRLDKATSGVVVFARNPEAHRFLSQQFSLHTTRKIYLALVHGAIAEEQGEIREPLREFGSGRVGVDHRKGKVSLTRYEVAERLGAFTLVRAYPHTGRRHQLRAHFYSLGHPIAGDPRYGSLDDRGKFQRLMLHALAITFQAAPGDEVTIEARVPASFDQVVETIRTAQAGTRPKRSGVG